MPRRPARRMACVVATAAVLTLLAACSNDDGGSGVRSSATVQPGGSGPSFGRCGGVSTAEVSQATGIGGLTAVTDNTSGCEWVTGADQLGPQFSFNWYRGSPIGRERATEQLSRATVRDITLGGKTGFIASDEGICEIGIPFGGDFFEWSVSYGVAAAGVSPRATEQICAATTKLANTSIERAR